MGGRGGRGLGRWVIRDYYWGRGEDEDEDEVDNDGERLSVFSNAMRV